MRQFVLPVVIISFMIELFALAFYILWTNQGGPF